MLKAIRDFFRKTCKDCEHYSWYRTEDKLRPDKTVINGAMLCESCEKMGCRLNDLKPCVMFRERSRTHNSYHAIQIHTGSKNPYSVPPKGGSNIPRP